MAAYYLAAKLLLLLLIYWRVASFNPISPSVVSAFVYFASAILLAFGPQSLHRDLSAYTIIIIISALFVFFIGEMVARFSFGSAPFPGPITWVRPIRIGAWTYATILAFALLTLVWSYYSIKEMAFAVGYREGEHLLIQYGRLAVLQHEMRPSPVLIIFGFMLRALSYVLTFAYLYNKVLALQKVRLPALLLLPSLIYLPQYMLWGSRGAVIEYISFFIFVYAYFKSRVTRSRREYNLEILALVFKGLAIFFCIFVGAGVLKGWAGSSPFDVVAIYGGGSLSALDVYLSNPTPHPIAFGQETLLGIYALLERVGVSSVSSSRILEFTTIGQTEATNIYTSIRRYISDYGVLGMLSIQFTLGYLFSVGFIKLQRSNRIGFFSLFYSMLFMMLVYQALDEQALTTFLSITQLFTVLFAFLFYRLLLRSKLNKPEQSVLQKPISSKVELLWQKSYI